MIFIYKLFFRITILIFFIVLEINTLQAQSITLEKISSFRRKNSGVIKDHQGVKGYYFFYKKEKIDSKMNVYILKIVDENLNEIASKEITDSKHLILQAGSFNGNVIMLKFFDRKKRELSFRSFTTEGKLIETDVEKIDNKFQLSSYGVRYNYAYTRVSQNVIKQFYAVNQRGFVDYEQKKDKYYGYEVIFFPTDGKSKKWMKKSSQEVKSFKTSDFLYANNDFLLSSVVTRPKLINTRNMRTFINSSNLETGSEEWSTELTSTQYDLSLVNSYTDEEKNEIILFGSYFRKGVNTTKARSLGIFSIVMNIKTGEIKNSNYISWENHVNNFLPTNKKGKVTNVGYLYFHEFFKTSDGRIFGVGEQYHKVVNPVGVVTQLIGIGIGLGRGIISPVKIVIKNFYIFEFNDDFSLKGIKIVEKGKSSFALPEGSSLVSVARLGLLMKAQRSFDFQFIQSQDEAKVIHIGYLDYDRIAKKGSRSYFGAITYTDSEFTQDKIVLKREQGNQIKFYPAKAGHILVIEYNRKEKKLDIRLETINF